MAVTLEYLIAEILELSWNAANHNSKQRITPRHILLAVKQDEELNELMKDVIIPRGNVRKSSKQLLLKSKYRNGKKYMIDALTKVKIANKKHVQCNI